MSFNPVSNDIPQVNYDVPTANATLAFESAGEMLCGHLFIAQGRGPHPTVFLLHGFPGTEQNFDLAHAARRAGWNAAIFHYRGSWGSGGSYSFGNVLEDTDTAVNTLVSEETAAKYRIDPSNIVLVGHSLGGFAALMIASQNAHVRAVGSLAGANLGKWAKEIAGKEQEAAYLAEGLNEDSAPLRGTSGTALVKEIVAHRDTWDLTTLPPQLAEKPVLMVAGSRDEVVVPTLHHDPLVQAFQDAGHVNFETQVLDADHSFSDKRIALAGIVVRWLENIRE